MYLTLQRYLMMVLAGLILMLGTFHAVRYFRQPDLFPGDRMELRTCRFCGGSGRDAEMAAQAPELGDACRACQSDGKVEVIIPGPERPTKIAGVVIDALFDREFATPDNFRPTLDFTANPENHRKEAHTLAGIEITIRSSGGEETALTSNEYGLFNTKLAPGNYTLTARGEGFGTLSTDLEIEPLTEPIWLEDIRTMEEPGSGTGGRSAYGQSVLVALPRAGTEGGRIAVTEGTP